LSRQASLGSCCISSFGFLGAPGAGRRAGRASHESRDQDRAAQSHPAHSTPLPRARISASIAPEPALRRDRDAQASQTQAGQKGDPMPKPRPVDFVILVGLLVNVAVIGAIFYAYVL